MPPMGHRHAPATRDRAIERVRRLSRWLAAGAALVTGVLVGVVAHEFPGHVTAGGATGQPAGQPAPPTTTPATPPTSTTLGQPGSPPTTAAPSVTPRVHASTGGS